MVWLKEVDVYDSVREDWTSYFDIKMSLKRQYGVILLNPLQKFTYAIKNLAAPDVTDNHLRYHLDNLVEGGALDVHYITVPFPIPGGRGEVEPLLIPREYKKKNSKTFRIRGVNRITQNLDNLLPAFS